MNLNDKNFKPHPYQNYRYSKAILKILILAFSISVSQFAYALPPLWETAYAVTELNGTAGGAIGASAPSGKIDGQENIALGFNFPFGGVNYTRISVDNNGGIVLKNDNTVTTISPAIWGKSNFQPDFSNLGQDSVKPIILPFGTSLGQLVTGGKTWFATYNNSFGGFTGMRAVITWENSTIQVANSTPDITFQAQLLDNGTIIFSYQTLTDPAGANWQTKADTGIVIGVSNGAGDWPLGSRDFSGPDFGVDLTGYEIWCKDDDPNNPTTCYQAGLGKNSAFDLDEQSVVFNPDGTNGYLVSSVIKNGAGQGGSGVCAVISGGGPGAGPTPPLWEPSYAVTELNGTAGGAIGASAPSGKIDGQENIALGFNFPFGGVNYTRISVDNNGGIVLENTDTVTVISPAIWGKANFQPDFSNLGQGSVKPIILPFGTSLGQLLTGGKTWFATYNNSFGGFTGMRAVVTWENSTIQVANSTPDITFQAQLLDDGTIIFSYQTLTDPAGAKWETKADQGIVVGISKGDGTWPLGSQNFTALDFGVDLTGYEIWCKNDNPSNPTTCFQAGLGKNSAFDLDDLSVVLNPDGASGYLVSPQIKNGNGKGGSDACAVANNGGSPPGGSSGGGSGGGSGIGSSSGGGSFPMTVVLVLTWLGVASRILRKNRHLSSIG